MSMSACRSLLRFPLPASRCEPEYRRPGIVRRVAAAVASSGIAILFGAILAIVVSFGIAMAVIWLTDLLK